jgi:xanthine dehydrogenase accessory factor
MKEIQEILKKISQFAPDEKAILATVIDVQGSGYRRPGARMLIDENGFSIGTVSGGCLEADVLERAKKVLETGEPEVITYDTTKDENSVFGLGMGCRGIVRILLETAQRNSYFDFLERCFVERRKGSVATLISKTKETNEDFFLYLGDKFFCTPPEKIQTNFAESVYELNNCFENDWFYELVTENLLSDLDSPFLNEWIFSPDYNSFIKTYAGTFGKVEFFIERIIPPVKLLLFGAGYDAIPLVELAKNLGWQVTVIDHRPAWANGARFPNVDEILVERIENLPDNLLTDENSVAVIMTHNYERDGEILRRLLNSPVKYIGALGPKKRTEKLLEESGETFSELQLSKLYAPIGLDIGAETPEQIALSIIAEIQSVLGGRNAGFLRDRKGGIH